MTDNTTPNFTSDIQKPTADRDDLLSRVSIVDVPARRQYQHARYGALLKIIVALEPGKCVKLDGWKQKEFNAIRTNAAYHGIRLRSRETPEALYVWVKSLGAPPPPSVEKRFKGERGQ